MSKKYNKTFTNLKTVVNDTSILNAQKILVNTPEDKVSERTDIIDYIGKSVDKLEDKVEFYISDVEHAPEQDSGRTNLVAFVIPVDTYPSDKIFTYVKADARQYVSEGIPCETPAYLGLMLQDLEDNREILALSDNAVVPQSGTPTIWNFSKGFMIPSGKKLAGFVIKNKEDFVAPNPTVHSDLRISLPMHSCENASGDFPDNSAKTDPEKGYHFGGSFDFANDGWWGWPVIAMGEVAHYKNITHLTPEQIKKLEDFNSDRLAIIDNAITNDNPDWKEIKQQVVVGTFEDKYYTTNLENRTNATHGVGIKIDNSHFIPGGSIIKDITLPYGEGDNGGFQNPHWCHIYPYDANDTLIGDAIISTTSTTRPADNEGETSWEFAGDESSKLPEDYDYIVIKVSGTSNPHPNDNGTYIRILVANISNTSDHSSFGDKCKIIGSGNYLGIVNVNYSGVGDTLLERIESLETVDFDNFATKEEVSTVENNVQTLNNKYTTLLGTTSAIQNDVNSLKEDNNLIFDELFAEETSAFTTNTANQLDAAGAIISGLRISKAHFLPGDSLIRDITLAYPSSKTDGMFTDQGLHIYVYDEAGNKIKSIFSTEARTRTAEDTDKFTTWPFGEDAILPENYYTVEMYLSGDSVEVTAATATAFRTNVTKSNGSATYDTDECCCWNGSTEYNWLAEVQATYSARQEPLYDIMESLRGKSFAYTDEDNTFTAKNTFNSLNAVITDAAESKADSLDASKRLTIDTEILEKNDVADLKRIVLGKSATTTLIGESQGSNGIAGVYGCRYTNPHFPAGNIVNIRVRHNIHHTDFFPTKPVYLYLNIDGSTVHRSIVPVVWTEPVSYSDFKFDNVSIPSTYTTVDVLMSHESSFEPLTDGTVVPSFNNFTKCIKFSAEYSTHADFSSCQTRVDGGVGAVALRLEVTSISTEDSELLSYAKKDEANIFTEENTFTTINATTGYIENLTVGTLSVADEAVAALSDTSASTSNNLVPDTANIVGNYADGNLTDNEVSAQLEGYSNTEGNPTTLWNCSFTPTENTWAYGVCKFDEASTDAYISVNDIKIYSGETLIGTTPFAFNMLLAAGDVLYISSMAKVENLRMFGCK